MAVGRITGPLLAKNLLRDGIDLAFENDLLYLDVTSGRIGIKTASPEYTLDVNGSFRAGNLSVSSYSTGTVVNNAAGDLIFQSTIDGTIRLQNNTLVSGNLHATGNITANGSVQIGNMTGTDTLSLYADIISDITPQTPNSYNIGSEQKYWAEGYFNSVIASGFTGFPGQDVNITPSTGNITNINSEVRIWGQNPLGTAPVVSNVLYVSMDGSDTNDGRAADATRACRTITAALRSPYYQSGTSIKVAPGHYYETNPLELKPYTSIIGSDLRTTVIEPIHKTQDLFHVQSGCYLAQMQFVNGQSGLLPGSGYTAGTNRGAYATAFPPNYGGAKIDLYHSPYIQNCTNQSGPWLQDGTMFNPNQTVQVPEAVGTATWIINTTTMLVSVSEGTLSVGQSINVGPTPQGYVNARTLMLANKPFIQEQVIAYIDQNNEYFGYDQEKCERDVRLIVESLVVDLVFGGNGYTQSNFAGLQYWNQNGYTGNIASELTTTTAAINYISELAQKIIVNEPISALYQYGETQVTTANSANTATVQALAADFTFITNILTSSTTLTNVSNLISPNGIVEVSTEAGYAVTLLDLNKTFIKEEIIAFITATYPDFVYDQTKCRRDVEYIIDCVSFDILYGGNRQAAQAGVYYYGFSPTDSAIPTERPQVTAAYYRIKDILESIITNDLIVKSPGNLSDQTTDPELIATATEAAALRLMVDKITKIINAGPEVADNPLPVSITKSSDENVLNAARNLQANKSFIVSEVIGYVESTFNNGFTYNEEKCYRDTGLIVDSIAVDLLYEGITQSTFAGLQYWNQSGYTGAIADELTTTTLAINYVSSLAQKIVLNDTTGARYSTGTQFTNASTATATEAATIAADFTVITNILTNGTAGVTDIIVPNGSASTATNIGNADALLQANKEYIQAEAVAYVNYITSGTTFSYNTATCSRDVGYMIDSVRFDLLHGGNRQAVQSGVYYYGFNGASSAIGNEIPQTTAAYNHIRSIVDQILYGQTVTRTTGNTATQITTLSTVVSTTTIDLAYNKIDAITNIINNGPGVAASATPIGLIPSTDSDIVNAYNLLLANRAFIQAETIAFTNQFSIGFVYNRAKCKRDIGIIVENIAYDIAFGGNQKSVESGLAYWNGVTSYIPNEITQTTSSINYINTLTQFVISNNTATNLLNTYQTSPQVINTALTGGSIAGSLVTQLVGVINTIIEKGPTFAPTIQVGNGPDWGSVSAEVLLQANRKFIQSEVVNWINSNISGFVYREDKCYRDTGLIIDAISQDIILNANTKTIEAAKTYWSGNKSYIANATYGNKDQVAETIAALTHAKDVALQVINNSTVSAVTFVFNSVKCSRDTGLIVDALAQDLLFNGNSQTTFAGIQYWNHDTYVGNIANEITTTTEAINYISSVAQEIVQNITSGTRYSTSTQNVSLPSSNLAKAAIIAKDFTTITNILTYGVLGITDQIIPNSLTANVSDPDIIKAYNLLQANKSYLQDEAIAWIETNKSFNYSTSTCARDTGLIVDSIAMDLAYPSTNKSQATFAGLQYWNQGGYTGQIASELTTVTNAIVQVAGFARDIIRNIDIVQLTDGIQNKSVPPATQDEVNILDSEFTLITNILTSTAVLSTVTDIIVSNSTATTNINVINAYTLLQLNRTLIQEETIAWIENNKTPGFTYNTSTCYRDVGYMIDSVSFDLLHGGNRQAVQSGVYYYDFNSTSTAIPNEIPQTVAAFEFIKTISQKIISNTLVVPLQTDVTQVTSLPPADANVSILIGDEISRITTIIENGPSAVGIKEPISLVASTNIEQIKAADILLANKEFIKAETIAYINNNYVFQYDKNKCRRDVAYIVDSVSFDLLYGGNRQAIQSGVYYYGYSNVSTSLPQEQVASTQAYDYMKSLISDIVLANPIATPYQDVVAQDFLLPAGTSVEVDAITNNITNITTIINEGPDAAAAATPISLTRSNNAFVNNAAALLHANREFIQAEVIAFVQTTINEQVILPFYDKGANATLSVVRNFDVLTNIIENGPGVAPIEYEGNGIFVKTGLSRDDIKVAPVITAITTVSGGVYQVDISQSTVGYGDSQTLYFGTTAVYPLVDTDVPNRWQQRRINPIGSMGGSLVDGGVISDRSPINSFVYDAYTQVNQGGNGIKVINNGYAQLVSVFTIFCSNAVTVENGGICSITNSNSNFGDQCLTAKGYGKREFSGYVKNAPVLPYFPNGVYPQGGQVEIYIADPQPRPHIALVMEVEPPVGHTNNYGLPGFLTGNTTIATLTTGTIDITGLDTTGMVIGQNFYVIDQYGRQTDSNNQPYVRAGTIISDVNYQSITLNYPLNSGGGDSNNTNYFNLYTCGNAYYTVLSSTVAADPITPGTLLLPATQNIAESSSTAFINSLTTQIIANQTVSVLQTGTAQVFDLSLSGGSSATSFISNELNLISSILLNGPGSAPAVTKTGTLPSGAGSAASLLKKNKEFIQAETIAYIDQQIYTFTYDETKCSRDTGLIVDAISQDLLFSTSSQSTFAGLQYWNQSGYTGQIASELTTTTAAINYVSELAQAIVLGVANTATANLVADEFTLITNILTSTEVLSTVTNIIVPNSLTSSTNVNIINAYNALQSNKASLQADVVDYVTNTLEFTEYDEATCARDVGYMIDSVSFDLLYGGNRQAVQSGVYYYSFNGASTAIPNEIPQTTAAYNYIATLTQQIVLGQPVTALQNVKKQVTNLPVGTITEINLIQTDIDNITNIINNGPSVVTNKTPISLNRSTDANAVAAANMLAANREFIKAEVIAYINKNFTYNKNTCRRDVGLLIDALVYDLEKGGNYNAVVAGKSYYATAGTHHIVQLEENVSDPALFPDGAITTFYQRSYMSASGYLFEYVGAGSNYGSLPQVGRADPVQTKEVVQLNNGKVFFTSTDQNGDFRIGQGLVISQATGVLSGRTFTKSLFANLTPFILAIEGI